MSNGTLGIRRASGTIPATRQIINGHSSGGVATGALTMQGSSFKTAASGSLTANVLAQLVSVSGAGWCPLLLAYAADTTSRTIRLQVVVDGVVVFDATSSAITTINSAIVAAGTVSGQATSGNSIVSDGECIRFNRSLVVRLASSVTETDKVTLAYKLMLE